MLKARSFDEIDRWLVNTPLEALNLSSGAVFRQQDHVFRRKHSVGWDASPLRELRREEDEAVLRSVDTSAAVRLPRDAWNRHGLDVELQAPCLAVPVCGDVLGAVAIVLFGPHENGNDIDQDECEMLSDLATGAAGGYERVAFVLLSKEVTELRASLATLKAAT
jgi:hypothetical protein